MRRYSHDGAGAVAREHILGDPDRDALARQGVDTVGAGEYAGDGLGLGDTLALGLLLDLLDIFGDSLLLFGRSKLLDEVTLRSEDHEGHSEDSVDTGGENGDRQMPVAAYCVEYHLASL